MSQRSPGRYRRSPASRGFRRGVGLAGPERPLLKGRAPPVRSEADDPQVAVLLGDRTPVPHLEPHLRGVASIDTSSPRAERKPIPSSTAAESEPGP